MSSHLLRRLRTERFGCSLHQTEIQASTLEPGKSSTRPSTGVPGLQIRSLHRGTEPPFIRQRWLQATVDCTSLGPRIITVLLAVASSTSGYLRLTVTLGPLLSPLHLAEWISNHRSLEHRTALSGCRGRETLVQRTSVMSTTRSGVRRALGALKSRLQM